MLVYHPIFDVNHCVFRIMRLLHASNVTEFEWVLLRLLDFYTVFPQLLKQIQPLPQVLASYRSTIKNIPEPYEAIKNSKRIAFEATTIQDHAIRILLAKNIVNLDNFLTHRRIRIQSIPAPMIDILEDDELVSLDWFHLVADELPHLEFEGSNGLKKRSGLLEYRYDD